MMKSAVFGLTLIATVTLCAPAAFSAANVRADEDLKALCPFSTETAEVHCYSSSDKGGNQLKTVKFLASFKLAKAELIPTEKRKGTLACSYAYDFGTNIHYVQDKILMANTREEMLDLLMNVTDVVKPAQIEKPPFPSMTVGFPYKKSLTGKIKIDEFGDKTTQLSIGLAEFQPNKKDNNGVVTGDLVLMINGKPAVTTDGRPYITGRGCYLF